MLHVHVLDPLEPFQRDLPMARRPPVEKKSTWRRPYPEMFIGAYTGYIVK